MRVTLTDNWYIFCAAVICSHGTCDSDHDVTVGEIMDIINRVLLYGTSRNLHTFIKTLGEIEGKTIERILEKANYSGFHGFS